MPLLWRQQSWLSSHHGKAFSMNMNVGRGWILAGLLIFTAGTAGLAGAGLAQGGQMLHNMHGMPGHGSMMAMDPAAISLLEREQSGPLLRLWNFTGQV